MSKNVLVVDDSVVIYETIRQMLSTTDYKIIGHAKSGQDAVDLYEELRPDCVTMDIVLPDMDGLEAARTIIGRHPDAKIVMASSLAYDDTMQEAEEIGAKGFLCKPVERVNLLEALDKCYEDD